MCFEGKRRFQFVAAIEQIEELTDYERNHCNRARKPVGRVLRLHPEERPQRDCEQCHADKNNSPYPKSVEQRTINRARWSPHDIKFVGLEGDYQSESDGSYQVDPEY